MIFYKIGSIPSGRLLISPKETDPVFLFGKGMSISTEFFILHHARLRSES